MQNLQKGILLALRLIATRLKSNILTDLTRQSLNLQSKLVAAEARVTTLPANFNMLHEVT